MDGTPRLCRVATTAAAAALFLWLPPASCDSLRPQRIMALGDSITYGCGDQCDALNDCMTPPPHHHHLTSRLGRGGRPGAAISGGGGDGGSGYHPGMSSGMGVTPCSRCSGGYRGHLRLALLEHARLAAAAAQPPAAGTMDWTAVQFVGNLENDDANGRHEGHIGWNLEQLQTAMEYSGGVGLGRTGEGGHPDGSMDGGAGWASLQPDVILLHAGSNDILQGLNASMVYKRTDSLLGALFKRLPEVKVYVSSLVTLLPYGAVVPAKGTHGTDAVVSHAQTLAQHNEELPKLVQQYASWGYSVRYVAMQEDTQLCNRDWALPLGSVGVEVHECCPDKVHPADAGYKSIASVFYKALTTLPKKEGTK